MVCLALLTLYLPHMAYAARPSVQNAPGLKGGAPLNILLILADDLGWSDLSCYGADLHETPNLDRFAGSSVRFTHAYAPSPVCSPTRASILTGKAPARLQMTIWSEGSLGGPKDQKLLQAHSLHDLPHSEITLAERLQAAGYLTAHVGKWHLGDADHGPETQGFEVGIGGTRWGAPQTYFYPYRGWTRTGGEFRYIPGLGFGKPGEYLTDRLTDEALRVIDQASATKRPFFLYLAHHAPHTPIEAKPADVAHFKTKVVPGLRQRNPTYAAMVKSLDDSVGRVLQRLKARGLDRNTVVAFTSDNGGYLGSYAVEGQSLAVATNAPLRSGKGTCYEGGLRVPAMIRWPGVSKAGSTCATPILLTDLFPTLLEAAGLAPSTDVPADGLSLAPVLADPTRVLPRSTLYFHYPHYYHAPPSTPVSAVRSGDWKLIEFLEDHRVELYDLARDPGEQRDLASLEPATSGRLLKQLQAWRDSVGAAMPTPNPAYKAPVAR